MDFDIILDVIEVNPIGSAVIMTIAGLYLFLKIFKALFRYITNKTKTTKDDVVFEKVYSFIDENKETLDKISERAKEMKKTKKKCKK